METITHVLGVVGGTYLAAWGVLMLGEPGRMRHVGAVTIAIGLALLVSSSVMLGRA